MFDFTFDHEAVLRKLGLESSTAEVKAQVINAVEDQLHMRMRLRMNAELSEQELKTFAGLANKSDAQAQAWLVHRFPDYEAMYRQELDQLTDEMKRAADAAVESSKKNI